MSFEKKLEEAGVQLTESNTLPAGQRQQRVFKRVIAAVRAAEAETNDHIRITNERCSLAQERSLELERENQRLRQELMKLKLRETLEGDDYDKLTVAQAERLLEAAS